MRVDLHAHATERSGCATSCEEDMIRSAIDFGLDGMAFTDHRRFVPAGRIEELNGKYAPFRIFTGIEVDLIDGEDVLIVGVRARELEARRWHYADIHPFVRERGGYIAIAHPFRYKAAVNLDLETFPPDALEAHSTNIGLCDESLIRGLAEKLGCRIICSSDAHSRENVGIYRIKLDTPASNDGELVVALKAGAYQCESDQKRIARFNAAVAQREERVRAMIAEGRDRDYYRKSTGDWESNFDRVAMGRSSMI